MQPPPRSGFAPRRGIQHVRIDGSWLRLDCTAWSASLAAQETALSLCA